MRTEFDEKLEAFKETLDKAVREGASILSDIMVRENGAMGWDVTIRSSLSHRISELAKIRDQIADIT